MAKEFNQPGRNENIQAENDFLKMKLMLEQGAVIHSSDKLSPAMENDFLNYVIEFEKQAANPVYTTVFKKIASPSRFKKVQEIGEDEIETRWDELLEYMNEHGIDLSCCSPNVSPRELYRFTTEELFNQEMDDINIPGIVSCFIYDQFHPDHKYDNTRTALDDCIEVIFRKEPMNFIPWFARENISLNNHKKITEEQFRQIVNRFKDIFDEIKLLEAAAKDCQIHENVCKVSGYYKSTLSVSGSQAVVGGNWLVEYFLDENEFWNICNVQIEGVAI